MMAAASQYRRLGDHHLGAGLVLEAPRSLVAEDLPFFATIIAVARELGHGAEHLPHGQVAWPALGLLALGVSFAIAAAGLLLGRDALDMFFTGVSLAVAVVPEGLPAVVTITLAIGLRPMGRRRVPGG